MPDETIFRIGFWMIFGGMILLQAAFAARAAPDGGDRTGRSKSTTFEGRGTSTLRAVRSLALLASFVLYTRNPAWLGALSVPIPAGLRWVGVALGMLCLAFYAWSRATLGRQWSSYLLTHHDHRLVTTGPYARIRHPIYLAMLTFMTSITLVAANGLFIALLLFSIVDLALRIPKEERMMIEVFGEAYRAYMLSTGKLWPK